jgi:peptidyl-prolyl cis-trans isomerase D
MATLERIRNRAGLLIAVIIGMAIFAFVLQDMLTGGSPNMMGSRVDLAEIDGTSVSYEEYANRLEKLTEYYRLRLGQSSLDEQTMESLREQTWQDIVREYSTSNEYDELGVAVSIDELMDMVQGRNPHPVIRSLFSDPETGILNRTFLVQFIRTMDEDPSGAQKTIWLYLEKQIMDDRAFTKYTNLISKGLFVTGMEAENNAAETNRKMDFSYIVKRFSDVPDSLVKISDNDLQKYYREHQNEYLQEATRDLEYLVFEVIPSDEDDRMADEWIKSMKDEFERVEDAVALVNLESDQSFDEINYGNGDLPDVINDFMFSSEPGAVYGPFLEDNSYTLARLVDINYLPDSVHARHILLQPDANRDANAVVELADSLKEMIENGAGFESLAMLYGTDGTAQLGGDLGWFTEGSMVKPFSDSCFNGKPGNIMIVPTQFGLHITEVIEKSKDVKKVRVAYLSRRVEPSSETYQAKYTEAVKFAGINNTYEKFNSAVSEQGFTKRYASDINESQRTITGLESPRQIIRWAFEAELNDVSDEIFEFGNKYVIAVLTGVREKGVAPLDQIRAEIELEVEKLKKAEIIAEEFSSTKEDNQSIFELSEAMGLIVQDANNISFSSVSLPSAGLEPKIIAAASILEQDQISKPVVGNNGVYVLVVNAIQSEEAEEELAYLQSRMSAMRESEANFEAYNALRESAEIEDNRSVFY